MDIRPEPLSSDEEGWSDPELPRSDEEERSHLERRRRYEEGRSDPEPLSSDEETSEPVALIGDSRFHPDPSLCSECQNILVSVTSFPDPISSLKDIHKRRHRCMCCEVIFNINRRGIRWKTFSATRYPFTPLDAGSIDESMDSVFIYSFDRSLALKCLDKQASHVSKVEVLMIEKPLPHPDHSSSLESDSLHLIERHLNVDLAAAKVQKWLGNCRQNHGSCRRLIRQAALPDRILDIGTVDEPNMRLLEQHQENGDYVTLSYCWGSKQRYVTTTETLPSFLSRIEEDKLPSTIQDAIRLTRALRIRFLWIDSLCILQGSTDDWGKQSAKMDQVYGNAYLTLCASRASTASEGFWSERPPTTIRWGFWDSDRTTNQIDVFLRWDKDGHDMSDILADEPLSSRGWAVQERLLSLRKVFFTSQQMIWQCPGLNCFEDGTDVTRADDRRGFTQPLLEFTHRGWNKVIHNYTQCNLTEFSDRLPALSGIARLFGEKLQGDYLAGHWRKDLPYSMMWQPLRKGHECRSDGMIYTGPSWSWASVKGGVRFFHEEIPRFNCQRLVKMLDARVEVSSSVNPYGHVNYGWIDLEAPVLPVRVEKDHRKGHKALFKIGESEYLLYRSEAYGKNDYMWLDDYEDSVDALAVFFHEINIFGHEYYGLLVTALDSGQETYVRRGGFIQCAIFPYIPHQNLSSKAECLKALSEVKQARIQRIKIV